MSKECASCHKILDESFFSINKRNKDGLHSYCKKCNAERAKKYNQTKGKDKLIKYQKKQIDNGYFRYGHGAYVNMKKSAEKRKIEFTLTEDDLKLWWKNSENVCEYCQSNVEEYELIRDFIKSYNGTNKTILCIKRHVYNNENYYKIKTMTIDRKNSNEGYKLNNIVKSCWICNSVKSNKIPYENMKKSGIILKKIILQIMEENK